MSVVALAACVALAIGLITMRSSYHAPTKGVAQQKATSIPVKVPEVLPVAKAVTTSSKLTAKQVKPRVKNNVASSRHQFLALPGYDPAVPADELHVVRVQLPGSALWQMGAPISPDSGARQFMADFVVSQDGTPYAVRLVQ